MNRFLKIAALAVGVLTAFSSVAFAAGTAPIRATLEAKGYEISWVSETKSVIIRDGGFVATATVGKDNVTLENNTTYAPEEFFSDIDAQRAAYEEYSTMATVTEIGEGFFLADTEKLGEVMFRFDDNTHFHHEKNRMLYKADSLKAGEMVKVYFDVAMTASIPPQSYAIEVVFGVSAPVEQKLFVNGTITEVGEGFILAETETMGEVMFRFDENTNLHHEMNRMFYAFSDLEAGMAVSISHTEAMTASLPPQVYATEIIILNAPEAATLTRSGKIAEIGEDYFILENEEGTFRFNCDEQTNIHHIMNRRLYRFADLEAGIEVEVIHADAATFSLPPQSYAIEVVIK